MPKEDSASSASEPPSAPVFPVSASVRLHTNAKAKQASQREAAATEKAERENSRKRMLSAPGKSQRAAFERLSQAREDAGQELAKQDVAAKEAASRRCQIVPAKGVVDSLKRLAEPSRDLSKVEEDKLKQIETARRKSLKPAGDANKECWKALAYGRQEQQKKDEKVHAKNQAERCKKLKPATEENKEAWKNMSDAWKDIQKRHVEVTQNYWANYEREHPQMHTRKVLKSEPNTEKLLLLAQPRHSCVAEAPRKTRSCGASARLNRPIWYSSSGDPLVPNPPESRGCAPMPFDMVIGPRDYQWTTEPTFKGSNHHMTFTPAPRTSWH